jgi:hypothetical protein
VRWFGAVFVLLVMGMWIAHVGRFGAVVAASCRVRPPEYAVGCDVLLICVRPPVRGDPGAGGWPAIVS